MRLPTWLASVVLVLLGTEFAHSLAYRTAHPDEPVRERALAATGHGYLALAPLGAALLLGVALVALLLRFGAARRGIHRPRVSAFPFALLAPLVFSFQEYAERLAHDGAFPFDAALEPTFVIGLWLQAPFALLAWLVARCLLAAADSLARALAEPPLRVEPGLGALLAPMAVDLPRLPALACGHAVRGPPSLR